MSIGRPKTAVGSWSAKKASLVMRKRQQEGLFAMASCGIWKAGSIPIAARPLDVVQPRRITVR